MSSTNTVLSRSARASLACAAGLFLVGAGWGLASADAPAATSAAPEEPRVDGETFGGLAARPIGPAAMSGRIAALDAVEGDRLTIYVGAAGGGVWKSVDGGTTFKSVFDKYCQSIGAVAVDRSRPAIVWVGTGESWTRNSVSVGDGLYKSTDGGDSWQRVGLEKSEHIARIAIDPQHGDTVFVAAAGHLWDANPDRGLYRTQDGGQTWKRILFVNDEVGCTDVALDPGDPRIVYASTWRFRRTPYSFRSGGPGSGLYKSTDGGDTWKELRSGLPAGDLGRIAIAVAPSHPEIVYAVVEAKKSALFRSDDRGESWNEVNSGANIVLRPFYFSLVVVDPKNADRVYKPGLFLSSSDDGGRTFSGLANSTHSDHHALWISPKNPERLLLGTDGGVYTSEDRGNHWRFLANLPVSQLYHVSYDLERPYNVYSGLQDNGSWVAPSQHPGGIANRLWRVLGGGDGFWAFVDPGEPDFTYVEYQGGNILRVRKSTGETKEIKPLRQADEPELRFNWNAPIHLSPSRTGTLYLGSQFLFRSKDRGESWERISPDLSTNDPAKQKQELSGGLSVDNSSAENHCTIFTISESPRNADVVWVGTDDGNLQLTRDGGKSWSNVGRKIAGLPPGTWVSRVAASPHADGRAYATFDGHQTGDMHPYVYRTDDFGKTWTSLGTGDLEGYAHAICEDPVRADLLFLGTESGLFVTLDGGRQWARFSAGFPNVSVRDLVVQPREGDLLVATHGRGIYILDDLTPFRQLTPEVLASEAAFLGSRPAQLTIPIFEQRFDGDADFEGQSPPEAASIVYYLKKRHLFGDLRLDVYDAGGSLVSTLPGSKRRGINRVDWPMRLPPPKVPPATNLVPQGFSFVGPRLPEGTYMVKLVKGNETYSSQVEIAGDPRSGYAAEDRALQQKTVLRLYGMLETLTFVADAVTDARDQARARAEKLGADALGKQLSGLADRLEELRKTLVATKEGGRLTGEIQLRERLGTLYGAVNGYEGRPTQSQIRFVEVLAGELAQAQARFQSLTSKDLEPLNAGLEKRSLEPLRALSREDWSKRQHKS